MREAISVRAAGTADASRHEGIPAPMTPHRVMSGTEYATNRNHNTACMTHDYPAGDTANPRVGIPKTRLWWSMNGKLRWQSTSEGLSSYSSSLSWTMDGCRWPKATREGTNWSIGATRGRSLLLNTVFSLHDSSNDADPLGDNNRVRSLGLGHMTHELCGEYVIHGHKGDAAGV